MQDMKDRTTIGAYGLAIWEDTDANGYDAKAFFQEAGIVEVAGNDPLVRLTTS
ncbi:hypothetical protein IB286_14840 [Spongiibacter sp. KMU-158]|uniref:Uncharacterized protein n=1 Tax=Spongiibacter pelagi TaxID=2760804 RepID=A0A927C5S2_9GAMM|nr:hypothetical protein [Spongiibacter pelagi]MBD2860271.1 hypothetical protein [Spongiibacter pelagi]